MLCIIFTKRKMLAGAYINKSFILPLGTHNYTELKTSALSTLESHLPYIKKLFYKYGEDASVDLPQVIPVSLVFSLSFDADERKEVTQWLQHRPHDFRLIHVSNPASSFLYKSFLTENSWTGGYAVLEAFDDIVNLSYHYSNEGKMVEQYVPVPGLGWQPGRAKVLSFLVGKIKDNGLELNKEGKDVLRTSILHYKKNKPFKVSRQSDQVKITARIGLSQEEFNELLLFNCPVIKSFFSFDKMKLLNIYNVILMGNYFNNNVLQNYFGKEAELKKLTIQEILDDEQSLEAAAEGALLKTIHLLDAERRVKLEAQLAQMTSRNRLLEEINEVCTDESKIEAYKLNFFPRAKSIGIPREIAFWHIKERLQKVSVSKELAAIDAVFSFVKSEITPKLQKNDLPSVASADSDEESLEVNNVKVVKEVGSSRETAFSLPRIHTDLESSPEAGQALSEDNFKAFPTLVKKAVGNKKANTTNAESSPIRTSIVGSHFPILLNYFTIEKSYPNAPFIYFKGRPRGDKAFKVVRFISSEELNDPQRAQAFHRLYDWETSYYDKMSRVFTTSEGKYYYRDFIEGKKLADYIVEKGIHKKRTITKFNSQDLQLLRLIWGEINGLKFAYKNFNQDNFIVTTKLKWNLQREIGVKIVNFPLGEGTPEQMHESVHAILASLLKENVYSEFVEKFKF